MLPGRHNWVLMLKKLILSHNKLVYLHDKSFEKIPRLRHLDLSNNHIELIQKTTFESLSYLRHLNLTGNRLTSLSNANWLLPISATLRQFDVSHNDIHTISHEVVGRFKNLKLLDLSNNNLKIINDGTFNGLKRLMYLFLEHNNIEKVPKLDFKKNLVKLQGLDLSWNNFKEIEKSSFTNSRSLRWLRINSNKNLMVVEEESFINLSSLQTLEVAHNPKLIFISHKALKNCFNTQYFNIRKNALSSLQKALIESSHFLLIDASSNPFICDCTSAWFRESYVQGHIRFYHPTFTHSTFQSFLTNVSKRNSPGNLSKEDSEANNGSLNGGFKMELQSLNENFPILFLNYRKTKCLFTANESKIKNNEQTEVENKIEEEKKILLTEYTRFENHQECYPKIINAFFKKNMVVKMADSMRVYCLATGVPPPVSYWQTPLSVPTNQVSCNFMFSSHKATIFE